MNPVHSNPIWKGLTQTLKYPGCPMRCMTDCSSGATNRRKIRILWSSIIKHLKCSRKWRIVLSSHRGGHQRHPGCLWRVVLMWKYPGMINFWRGRKMHIDLRRRRKRRFRILDARRRMLHRLWKQSLSARMKPHCSTLSWILATNALNSAYVEVRTIRSRSAKSATNRVSTRLLEPP